MKAAEAKDIRLKTCRDCKKQDLYENFPKQKNRHGNYYALPRCSECHAKARVRYRKQNADNIATYGRRWLASHPEYKKVWRKDKRVIDRMDILYRNAHARNFPVELTEQEIADLFNSECYYCGDKPEGLCGIDRRDPRFGYLRNNVRAACTVCNFNKQSLTDDEFLAWITKIARRHKLL